MATPPVMMSVEEYLHTSFKPDCDYVDGVVEERHFGELEHGRLQKALVRMLSDRELEWHAEVVFEVRVQVASQSFRVPNICVIDPRFGGSRIIRRAPLLCIEVLSPEDRFSRVVEKIQDYHSMGVGAVWIFDPESKQVWVSLKGVLTEHKGGSLKVPGTAIELDSDEAFRRAQLTGEGRSS